MTKIEEFAQSKLGITLSPEQVSIIKAVTYGQIVLFTKPRGEDPVRQVLEAWIKEGLKDGIS